MARKLPPMRFYLLAGSFGIALVLFGAGSLLQGWAALLNAIH